MASAVFAAAVTLPWSSAICTSLALSAVLVFCETIGARYRAFRLTLPLRLRLPRSLHLAPPPFDCLTLRLRAILTTVHSSRISALAGDAL